VESNWNSKAVSHSGAMGLMQLMPTTVKDMNIKNPFNPEDNIDGGARYLRYLLDKFNGNLIHAIAAYNAGPTRVIRHRGIPPIRETRQYVKRVLSLYNDDKSIYTSQSLKSEI
jgi:soluble lytic murein transglycosylase